MQSSESCLWKLFLKSEQEQEKETVKTKKTPLLEEPNHDDLL